MYSAGVVGFSAAKRRTLIRLDRGRRERRTRTETTAQNSHERGKIPLIDLIGEMMSGPESESMEMD